MSEWYGSTISSTYSEFQQDRAGVPQYKMLKVQRPKDLTLKDSDDFTRFAISYGLSVPFGEGDFRATRRPRSQGIGCHWMLLATRTPRTFTTEDLVVTAFGSLSAANEGRFQRYRTHRCWPIPKTFLHCGLKDPDF